MLRLLTRIAAPRTTGAATFAVRFMNGRIECGSAMNLLIKHVAPLVADNAFLSGYISRAAKGETRHMTIDPDDALVSASFGKYEVYELPDSWVDNYHQAEPHEAEAFHILSFPDCLMLGDHVMESAAVLEMFGGQEIVSFAEDE